VGITGAPGTGKSTLVNRLAAHLRRESDSAQGQYQDGAPRVAIVAVDPTSPFSGGAILGDRIRMRDLAGDPGVFIRSMATRGALGGLARATGSVVEVLDAAGFEVILIETVGAGQAEVEIARTAHTTVVVAAPGLGDEVQAIKAGILEIADVIVVNKADLPGATNAVHALRSSLSLARHLEQEAEDARGAAKWERPILQTVATSGEGIPELARVLHEHHGHLKSSGGWATRERDRAKSHLEDLLSLALMRRFFDQQPPERYQRVLERIIKRELAPREALEQLMPGEGS
jgi:LAO/AO transport system kinase